LRPVHDPGEGLFDEAMTAFGDLEDEILQRHSALWEWRTLSLFSQEPRLPDTAGR
jgi:hypothetical protein